MTRTLWKPGRMGRARRRTAWGLILSGAVLAGGSCEHDPTILETHPLDLTGSNYRSVQSLYLEMDDGVRIAVDVHVPIDHPSGHQFPTILEMTRYWRSRGEEAPYTLRRASKRGFAYVVMDERGTGASFGNWPSPLTDRALEDAGEVMDWIVAQPWSNGLVGATGVSYPGMAAQQLAAMGHPALKAIVPMSDPFDQYEDLIFPGGVFNEAFMKGWSEVVYAMDRTSNLTVEGEFFQLRPVDDDPGGTLLAEAIDGHGGNMDAYASVRDLTFRDDVGPPGISLDDFSTHTKVGELDASGVAAYHWGSWLDGGSADGVIREFMASTGPRRAVIGSWTHDLSDNSFTGDPDRWTAVPTFESQWEEALNFFDDILRKGKPLSDRILRYYTMGEGLWKATSTWPIPGTETTTYFLGDAGTLGPTSPSAPEGEDPYTVDFEVSSATEPRWLGPLFAKTWYPDRRDRDRSLLVYQSQPLTEDMEVTGYPEVRLYLSSTHSDGAFFVYLEDVSPQGAVTYVTEGLLRGLHRKVTEDPSAWKRPTPFHSYLADDAQPMVPGEVVELDIGMEPTSFLFREGHSVRIAIAGHDASAFRRIPSEGTPVLSVQRNSRFPSSIQLPVVPRAR